MNMFSKEVLTMSKVNCAICGNETGSSYNREIKS